MPRARGAADRPRAGRTRTVLPAASVAVATTPRAPNGSGATVVCGRADPVPPAPVVSVRAAQVLAPRAAAAPSRRRSRSCSSATPSTTATAVTSTPRSPAVAAGDRPGSSAGSLAPVSASSASFGVGPSGARSMPSPRGAMADAVAADPVAGAGQHGHAVAAGARPACCPRPPRPRRRCSPARPPRPRCRPASLERRP